MGEEFQEKEGTLKIFVYFGTYYDRSIIMIGFVNISKAANELGDLMNFLGKNLDRLQIYNGRRGVEISSDVLWLAWVPVDDAPESLFFILLGTN